MLTIDNHEIQGSKGVLIKLQEIEEDYETNDLGVIIPLYENYESDGGRPAARIKEDTYSSVGEVIQISEKAKQIMAEELMNYKVGDLVSISAQQKHPSNQFLVDKDKVVANFSGYLILHPSMIQSKIINYNK